MSSVQGMGGPQWSESDAKISATKMSVEEALKLPFEKGIKKENVRNYLEALSTGCKNSDYSTKFINKFKAEVEKCNQAKLETHIDMIDSFIRETLAMNKLEPLSKEFSLIAKLCLALDEASFNVLNERYERNQQPEVRKLFTEVKSGIRADYILKKYGSDEMHERILNNLLSIYEPSNLLAEKERKVVHASMKPKSLEQMKLEETFKEKLKIQKDISRFFEILNKSSHAKEFLEHAIYLGAQDNQWSRKAIKDILYFIEMLNQGEEAYYKNLFSKENNNYLSCIFSNKNFEDIWTSQIDEMRINNKYTLFNSNRWEERLAFALACLPHPGAFSFFVDPTVRIIEIRDMQNNGYVPVGACTFFRVLWDETFQRPVIIRSDTCREWDAEGLGFCILKEAGDVNPYIANLAFKYLECPLVEERQSFSVTRYYERSKEYHGKIQMPNGEQEPLHGFNLVNDAPEEPLP